MSVFDNRYENPKYILREFKAICDFALKINRLLSNCKIKVHFARILKSKILKNVTMKDNIIS